MTAPSRQCRVLIADDEKVIADTLAQILNARGFNAAAVYSGERAVEMATAILPDAFISDVIMGAMNGVESALRIKRIRPDCKIILLSGQTATASLLLQARKEGHEFEVLTKPVHPKVILDLLTDVPFTCQSETPPDQPEEQTG